MKRFKRGLAAVLAFLCVTAAARPCLPAAAAPAKETGYTLIEIGDPEELIEFSKQCVYDRYGDRKLAVLTGDIDLTGYSWEPAAIFGGIFDGAGYTISHVKIQGIGSETGFFCRIKKSGVVKNLHIEGTVQPGGTKSRVGGIVGSNRGTIDHCTFSGSVTASEDTGGIAGFNYASGKIINSENRGVITGEKSTGGIAGSNEGLIESSVNYGDINTTDMKNGEGADPQIAGELGAPEDMGGIAGFSRGTIRECVNHGGIGYEHVGYNTGGIAGRLDGSVFSCANDGEINGRKDAGGIVGQFEPYLTLVYEEDTLQALEKAFAELMNITDELAAEVSGAAGKGSRHVKNINKELDRIRAIGKSFSDSAGKSLEASWDKAERSLEKIGKDIGALIQNVTSLRSATGESLKTIQENAEKLQEILSGTGSDADKNFTKTFEAVSGYLDTINEEVSKLTKELDGKGEEVSAGLKSLEENAKRIRETFETTVRRISEIVDETMDTVTEGLDQIEGKLPGRNGADKRELYGYLNTLEEAAASGEEADLERAGRALDGIDRKLLSSSDSDDIRWIIEDMREAIRLAREQIADLSDKALEKTGKALDEIERDAKTLKKNVEAMLTDTGDGLESVNKSFGRIKESLDEAYKQAQSDKGSRPGDFDTAVEAVSSELDALLDKAGEYSAKIEQNIEGIHTQAGALADILDGAAGHANKNWGKSAGGLSEALKAIHREVDEIARETEDTTSEIDRIYGKLTEQVHLIEDIAGDAAETDNGKEELVTDISEMGDTESGKGVISGSHNYGAVTADVNTGGITGIIASELSGDPEKDLDIVEIGEKSLRSCRYAKAVISNSENTGAITVKNSYGGGIAGRADLGSILLSLNTGNVESRNGSFVGGIAGMSAYRIRQCQVLCDLKGNNNIGGIAGKGCEIYDCYTMVRIDSEGEKLGAVAGAVTEKASGNYFIKEDLAGINGVNYEGQAMPLTYEELCARDGIREVFLKFHVTFVAEGKTAGVVDVSYGEAFPSGKLPPVPRKEGFFAKWEAFEQDKIIRNVTVNAEYLEWTKTISSGGEKPELLIEGAFSPNAFVKLLEPTGENPAIEGGGRILKLYDFKIEEAGDYKAQPLKVRVLAPKEEGGRKIALVTEGSLRTTSCDREGSYLVFSMDGEGSFAVLADSAGNGKMAGILAAAAAAFLIGAAGLLAMKRKGRAAARTLNRRKRKEGVDRHGKSDSR